MIKTFIFIIKYKILKDPINLSYHTKEFFELPKKVQRSVLDKYFEKLPSDFPIESYFDTKESRYYDNHQEITFFHCYYFDKLIIEHDITNIKLMDKFKLSEEKQEYLINYTLELIQKNNLKIDINELINYQDLLPVRISENIKLMKYFINENYYNVKYLTYNELCPSKQRELILESIALAEKQEFCFDKFLKQNKKLPTILETNIDFILFLVKHDIENAKYITEKLLESQTVSTKEKIIETLITSLEYNKSAIDYIEQNESLAAFLNKNEEFITYILNTNIANINYIDWHNLTDVTRTKIINDFTKQLQEKKLSFDIMNYSFRNLFFENYNFMKYLMEDDFRWIAIIQVNTKEESDKLIDDFFKEINTQKYKFRLEDFLEDGTYINHRLIENKKMLHYLFENKVPLVQHINFFNLKSSRVVVENLVNELEKTDIDYEFKNEDFLLDGKYPIPLSNSYRFMRYVIDKNFNHIAYIDTSMIDKRELKRIINYAFRMVYFIRGDNKKLNFDFEGYFKNATILEDEYFQECLKSL